MIVQVDAVLRWVGQDVHDVLNVANSRHIHDIIHISGNCFWCCISGIGKQCTDLLLHIFAFFLRFCLQIIPRAFKLRRCALAKVLDSCDDRLNMLLISQRRHEVAG